MKMKKSMSELCKNVFTPFSLFESIVMFFITMPSLLLLTVRWDLMNNKQLFAAGIFIVVYGSLLVIFFRYSNIGRSISEKTKNFNK